MTPPLASVPDLDRELDALYDLPLDEFTKARNDLATRLRKAHQADASAEVRALRKPTTVAWAANRLARDEPKLTGALLEAGRQLWTTQQRSLAGKAGADEVAAAAAGEREAIRMLLAAARTNLGDRATPALLDKLAQTLRAAAVDDAGRALLERGRLAEEVKAVGFGPLEAVEPKPAKRRADDTARAARERVNALRDEARRLTGEARDAERAADEAARVADRLRVEAQQKREAADAVAAELAAAQDAARSRR